MNEKLCHLESFLKSHIKGQKHAIERLVSVIKRGELGLAHPYRPKGSFLLVGPTGTGKTELTVAFTQYLFGTESLIRFDMSEYMAPSSVGKMIGEQEGQMGLLGQKLEQHTHGTFLFDEIEKADLRVLDLFLQILDSGRLTLANHQTYSLSNFYIVFTSNIGSSEIRRMTRCPFSTVERTVLSHVNDTLRPELIGRINEKIVFRALTYDVQVEICKHFIALELARLKLFGFHLEASQAAIEFLIASGFHRTLGARPMRYTVEKSIGDLLTDKILKNQTTSGILSVNTSKTALVLKPLPQEVIV